MQSFQESLVLWATVLQTVLSFIATVQSSTWLIMISLTSIMSAFVIGQYARHGHLVLASGTIEIEGRRLDCLNAANLKRHINTTLVVQEARHAARIEGDDLIMAWRYSGYCKAAGTSSIEFSVDGDNNVPFANLECFAYDLLNDPKRKHRIRPMLIGADGMTRKLMVPFAEPLAEQQPFDILFHCHLPGCMTFGLDYVTTTLSFAQTRVEKLTVQLEFVGTVPSWVRVYEYGPSETPVLLKDLQLSETQADSHFFIDRAQRTESRSARIYTFWREPLLPPALPSENVCEA